VSLKVGYVFHVKMLDRNSGFEGAASCQRLDHCHSMAVIEQTIDLSRLKAAASILAFQNYSTALYRQLVAVM
jgi:hypothetical protein